MESADAGLLGFRTHRGRRGTLAWTRTTSGGARGLLVDSMACVVAVRFVDEVVVFYRGETVLSFKSPFLMRLALWGPRAFFIFPLGRDRPSKIQNCFFYIFYLELLIFN